MDFCSAAPALAGTTVTSGEHTCVPGPAGAIPVAAQLVKVALPSAGAHRLGRTHLAADTEGLPDSQGRPQAPGLTLIPGKRKFR